MKKYFIILTVIASMIACNTSDNDPEAIKEQIFKYKSQIADLNNKIDELQKKLETLDTAHSNSTVSVGVLELQPTEFKHFFDVAATAYALNDAFISPQMNGQIEKIYVSEGQFVKKGQLLVSLNDKVIRKNIEELKTGLEMAKTLYEKQKELWDKKIGSEVQYLQAKSNYESLLKKLSALQAQLDLTKIYAPFSGYIDDIAQKEGEMANPGIRMIQLVDLSELKIVGDVSESYVTKIKKGDKAIVSFSSYPDIKINTTIYRTGKTIKTANRTFEIEARVKNVNNIIKPNSLATITLNDYYNPKALVVPSEIVKQDIQGKFLYVIGEKNGKKVAEKRYVKTGMAYDNATEITEGVQAGEKVIVRGFNNVKNLTPVVIK